MPVRYAVNSLCVCVCVWRVSCVACRPSV
jgi:hypothetical protein